MMEYVHSLRAALRVIEILQAVKTCGVDPDELESAINKHFDLFKATHARLHAAVHKRVALRAKKRIIHDQHTELLKLCSGFDPEAWSVCIAESCFTNF